MNDPEQPTMEFEDSAATDHDGDPEGIEMPPGCSPVVNLSIPSREYGLKELQECKIIAEKPAVQEEDDVRNESNFFLLFFGLTHKNKILRQHP